MKIYLDMVGCRLNQSELETFARQFRHGGHTLVSSPGEADMVVINTCTVTAAAASDSRQKIRQASRSGAGQIVVTGCWATLNQQLASTFPGVSRVVANAEKDQLVATLLGLPPGELDMEPLQRQPIPGGRLRTRAFIKVQDGCDNHCTYCITRLARGRGRSRSSPDILADIRSSLDGGSQEVVLTGVHLGSWGYDFENPAHLFELLDAILTETAVPRLRLSSLEPWDITPGFFSLWKDPRLCRHLHLPLQSGCAETLSRMGRRITPQSYAELIAKARDLIPGVAITTDIITGFPGETEAEYAESLSFIQEMAFTNAHIFTYSAMPGTPAASLPWQVPHAVARQRAAHLRSIIEISSSAFKGQQVGQNLKALWEKASPVEAGMWELHGLTDNYLPVRALFPLPCLNKIMTVHIDSVDQGGLSGEVIEPSSRGIDHQDTL